MALQHPSLPSCGHISIPLAWPDRPAGIHRQWYSVRSVFRRSRASLSCSQTTLTPRQRCAERHTDVATVDAGTGTGGECRGSTAAGSFTAWSYRVDKPTTLREPVNARSTSSENCCRRGSCLEHPYNCAEQPPRYTFGLQVQDLGASSLRVRWLG